MLKKYILPILIGAAAGTIAVWAFDSFENQNAGYFAKAFLKSLIPVTVVVLVLNSRREK